MPDRLFERDGRTLSDLESGVETTRFGVMKHLRLLEESGLVVTRKPGREKLHFLSPVPIQLIHNRWIDKYAERRASAPAELKATLEDPVMTETAPATQTVQVNRGRAEYEGARLEREDRLAPRVLRPAGAVQPARLRPGGARPDPGPLIRPSDPAQ
ncbi:helix-turn-helix domain-containing protein [Nonomuraea sp. NPDC049709]|uniref:ArsR/SmtB family transcription factor n=1 Tax=Nonomuraea sp. NPDC049709 TaxID=3154736 RepID=UPI00343D36CF